MSLNKDNIPGGPGDALVRVQQANGVKVSLSRSVATSAKLRILKDEDAIDPITGQTVPPDYSSRIAKPAATDLAGKELADALKAVGLPVSGTADEKRTALADYQEALGSGLYQVEDGVLVRDDEGGYVPVEGDGSGTPGAVE